MRRAGQATIERRRVAGRAPTSPTVRARQLLLHAARDQAGQRVGALAARGDGEELAARYRHHVADLLVFQPIPQPRLPVHLMAATQPDGAPAVTARSSMSRARAGLVANATSSTILAAGTGPGPRSTSPAGTAPGRSALRHPVHHQAHGPRRIRGLPAPSPGPGRPAPAAQDTTKICRNVNAESCRLMCKQRGR